MAGANWWPETVTLVGDPVPAHVAAHVRRELVRLDWISAADADALVIEGFLDWQDAERGWEVTGTLRGELVKAKIRERFSPPTYVIVATDEWHCSDCGSSGTEYHACPGRPGEGEG